MKKLFTLMALFMATAMIFTGCKSDDDDSEQKNQNFAKMITANTWEGTNLYQYKEMGEWIDRSTDFVVLKFTRTSATDLSGTGWQLQFDGNYYKELQEKSEFKWYISGDRLYISYQAEGWGNVNAIIDDATVNSSVFSGWWWDDSTHRYQFNYKKSSFVDFDKYTK